MTYRSALPSPCSAAPNGPVLHEFLETHVIDGVETVTRREAIAASFFSARASLTRDGVGLDNLQLVSRVDVEAPAPAVPEDRWSAFAGWGGGYEEESEGDE